MKMKTKTLTREEKGTYTIKRILTSCLAFILIFVLSFSTITASAKQSYMVTILLIPDKSVDYTDYDEAYLTILNNHTGKTYHYTLYPYNNFSDKVRLEEGEYSVLDAGIKGRSDVIFNVDSEDIVVNRATAIIVNFGDSKIIKQNTTETTTEEKRTSSQQVLTTSATTKQEPHTFFSIPDETHSGIVEVTDSSEISIPDITDITTSITEEITQKTEDVTPGRGFVVPVTVVAILLAVICAVFFIVLYKKNKEDR